MSAENRNAKSSNATTWIVTLVCLFVVYMATYPMVFGWGVKRVLASWTLPPGMSAATGTGSSTTTATTTSGATTTATVTVISPGGGTVSSMTTSAGPPMSGGLADSWYILYGIPYFTLARVPGLDRPLQTYLNWWVMRSAFGGAGPTSGTWMSPSPPP